MALKLPVWPWKKPAKSQIQVVRRSSTSLRLHEWREQSELLGFARDILGKPEAQMMLDVLRNEHPGSGVLAFDTADHIRAAHQARCEGYTMALANLEALAKPTPPVRRLEATFEAEETEPKPIKRK